mmetsp:Transcript_19434/g.54133  ORF Transcript_19434/g.54133 Transcript_19434/m.54133 type:complete len:133 (+) Transcript_19434:134-532(+)
MLVAKERYSAISVDLGDGEWTNCFGTKGIGLVIEDHDLITNGIVMVSTTFIFLDGVLVNNRLTFRSKELDISDDGNWKKHVTMESNSTRGNAKCFVHSASHSKLCRGKNIVNEISGLLQILRRIGMEFSTHG